jgi:type IV secretory pathway TraG/TraD family ATPase VirD4
MSDPFGNARTSTEDEVTARFGKSDRGSIYLGRYYDRHSDRAGAEIPYKGDRHLLIFGPTGSGKGARFLLPNLLTGLQNQSVIVIDPKGEAAAVTADARRKMGHEVVILNPFNVLGLGSAGFNPLDGLNPKTATFYDDAAAIGEALIKTESSEPHWSESAQGLVVGLIMWEIVRAAREERAPLLENVRQMLTEPDEREPAPDGKGPGRLVKGLRVTASRACAEGGFTIESLLGRFVRETDEVASIQSTADTQSGVSSSTSPLPPLRNKRNR